MATIGAGVAAVLAEPVNVIAGLLAFHLAASGWLAAARKAAAGRTEKALAAAPLLTGAAMFVIGGLKASGVADLLAHTPTPAPFVIGGVSTPAAVADLHAFRQKALSGPSRTARHLWRMCAALLIADTSLFLGQPKVFPPALRDSPIMFAPELFVAAIMAWHLVRLASRPRRATLALGV